MSTVGDVLKAVKEVLLLQSEVERLSREVQASEERLVRMSDRVNDVDKRLFAIERIMDLGAKQVQLKRIEEE